MLILVSWRALYGPMNFPPDQHPGQLLCLFFPGRNALKIPYISCFWTLLTCVLCSRSTWRRCLRPCTVCWQHRSSPSTSDHTHLSHHSAPSSFSCLTPLRPPDPVWHHLTCLNLYSALSCKHVHLQCDSSGQIVSPGRGNCDMLWLTKEKRWILLSICRWQTVHMSFG